MLQSLCFQGGIGRRVAFGESALAFVVHGPQNDTTEGLKAAPNYPPRDPKYHLIETHKALNRGTLRAAGC